TTYGAGCVVYFCSSLGFFFLAVAKVLNTTVTWGEVNHIPYFVFMFLSALFFLDILETFEFVLRHFSKSVGSPVKTFISNFFKKYSSKRLTEIFQKIPIFNTLSPVVLQEMNRSSRIVELKQGTVICRS